MRDHTCGHVLRVKDKHRTLGTGSVPVCKSWIQNSEILGSWILIFIQLNWWQDLNLRPTNASVTFLVGQLRLYFFEDAVPAVPNIRLWCSFILPLLSSSECHEAVSIAHGNLTQFWETRKAPELYHSKWSLRLFYDIIPTFWNSRDNMRESPATTIAHEECFQEKSAAGYFQA